MAKKRQHSEIVSGRTRFGDIVAEFWMPRRPSGRAVILCDGCPTVPSKHALGGFLARKGFWVFHPRYRGTWESGGEFLQYSPAEDVLLVAEGLKGSFKEMWSGVRYVLDIRSVIVVGASFGGTAAVLASQDDRIAKAVALAPVIDWRREKGGESFEEFLRQITEGFGGAYRAPKKNYLKLKRTKFYSPVHAKGAISSKKLLLIHAKDDDVVPVLPLKNFSKKHGMRPIILPTGGHLSASALMQPKIWKKINNFLKK